MEIKLWQHIKGGAYQLAGYLCQHTWHNSEYVVILTLGRESLAIITSMVRSTLSGHLPPGKQYTNSNETMQLQCKDP